MSVTTKLPRVDWFLYGILLLIPFMQIGVSYYLSFNTLLLVLVVIRWGNLIAAGAQSINVVLGVAILMFVPMAAAPSWDFTDDMLRIGREALMFCILASALTGFRVNPPIFRQPPLWFIGGMIAALLLLCLIQEYYLPRGVYVGFPEEYFAQESGTFASVEALRYGAQYLRPQGTFSEPSYLGFVLLSFALMIVPRLDRVRETGAVLAMIVITGLLSRSLSFVLAMVVVVLIPLLFYRRINRGVVVAGTALAAAVAAFFTDAYRVFGRLFATSQSIDTDISAMARISRPVEILPDFFAAYPLGVPGSVVEAAMAPFMPDTRLAAFEILNNALFNLIFLYGVVGVLVIGTLLFLAKDLHARMYLLACTMFNGSFLAIDKVALITLTLAMYEGGKMAARQRARVRAARLQAIESSEQRTLTTA